MNGSNVRRLTTSAVMIAISTAIAVVCEFIPFLNLPFGGTITFASMLPIIKAPRADEKPLPVASVTMPKHRPREMISSTSSLRYFPVRLRIVGIR